MIAIFRICGLLYVLSSLWSIWQVELVTTFLGIQLLNNVGMIEYLTIYGGLQMGLGVAIVLTSMHEKYLEGGIFFSAVFSLLLAVFRVVSFVLFDMPFEVIPLVVLESIIAIALLMAWFRLRTR